MMSAKYELINGIDINNTKLVDSLKKYIENISDSTMLKKVFNNAEGCKDFIFNYIKIDDNDPTFKVDDISFLSNDEEIIGHLILRIKKEKMNAAAKLTTRVYEKNIPAEFDSAKLIDEYLEKRVNKDTKKSDLNETVIQR